MSKMTVTYKIKPRKKRKPEKKRMLCEDGVNSRKISGGDGSFLVQDTAFLVQSGPFLVPNRGFLAGHSSFFVA